MSMAEIYQQLVEGIKNTSWQEFTAVMFGIASVIFSRLENIWVYPTGLINTIMYTYFCFFWWNLYAEASLNFYFTVMSIYGWFLWSRNGGAETEKKGIKQKIIITASSKKEWKIAIIFFMVCWSALYFILRNFTKSNVPLADSFASAAAYTAMWLMAKKKIENWIWWILTNLASIPLYFYKNAIFTSFQYIVFLILAIMGYISWKKKIAAYA
jgi:nicotinamide mononucleotide transporter